ncbi:transferrin-binding protein-like solute binding protein [Novosphingobium album (ex Liu et al. 2023)]|uniref:Transferrin-binding protein-like solute binding protein n=1 Tax=Novosphingobium album (ex Liu et al. 2023) TaxID=3031130 RepID=A0ABT5WNJ2_9SPHN|nr:transferrin-binding protein-like solute binding protein [Novosphingobium album (ex Liu et al. 2023)]MDE8651608.1 transferrin-binding protein-like solute binding protein [Novosphingobium album (ex Liu et al. 2023)]
MRHYLLLSATCLLAACGGGGETTISTPPPVNPDAVHSFVHPTEPKTYQGIGGSHVFEYLTDERQCCNQQGEVYAGNSSTARDSAISITYNPREAVYTLELEDQLSGADTATRFQDPGSRTDFGGAAEPQWGVPHLANPNIHYLQAGDGDPRSPYDSSGSGLVNAGDNQHAPTGADGSNYQSTTLFVLEPGSETKYVTYAGYVRNAYSFSTLETDTGAYALIDHHLERGSFAFGERTDNGAVPRTGSGSYHGSMIASMIFNPTLDGVSPDGTNGMLPNYFQWIEGTADLAVNFANSSVNLALDGKVYAPHYDYYTGPQESVIKDQATFAAHGAGTINMINFGGFKGEFSDARFVNPNGTTYNVNIAGSSIDGTFFGPAAEEAGGGFRIVGGNPDERIDILGAFVGKK